MNVAIIGASADKTQFGNKAVRAYQMMGHTVFPVNNHENYIEGLECYKKVTDIPYNIDRVSIYLPPEITLKLINQIKRVKPRDVYLNPGAESDELVEAFKKAGINTVLACSIVAIGVDPGKL